LLPLKGNFNIFDLRGRHVDPEHWNKLLEDPEFIVLDVRNEYETRIGTFKNSLIPSTKHFTDLPEYIHNNKKIFKNKKIAMFCTGGIRCEIASSFFMSEGIDEVYLLKGGVLNYFNKVDKTLIKVHRKSMTFIRFYKRCTIFTSNLLNFIKIEFISFVLLISEVKSLNTNILFNLFFSEISEAILIFFSLLFNFLFL